ncbi:MAG TPA: D-alanyl-D-alanine carboxypeptidase family protein [Actinomycetota bacterium]|nr:D-alanyl-D-alanine carboxypeptidase family protein [Actinomycetota bacterium]
MTLLTAAIASLVVAIVVAGISLVGQASALDTRAQTAADAAALAAVAESVPGGSGRPHALAARYAELNGARLVECICPAGATAVQVRVAVGDVIARARAVMDPSLLGPLDVFGSIAQLDPRMRAAVTTLLQAARGSVHVTSGFRSHYEQERLWADAVERHGSAEAADDWVAPPGASFHERGLAVDLAGDLLLARRLVAELDLPLHQPLGHEPWHFELIGSR